VGTSYYNLGKIVAEQALRIFKGTKPFEIPVSYAKDSDIYLNQKTADEIGVKLAEDLVKKAKQVFK
jgi:putative ABC transport system substrate-binding protein